MDKLQFEKIIEDDKKNIDNKINSLFSNPTNLLEEAVFYAIDGGKRIRPVLFLETYKMLTNKEYSDDALTFAISIEMIHAYSLIHDDMPCLDNDDYRRGKESVHKKYGQDIGLLAGDYLLNKAFENMLAIANKDHSYISPSYYISKCSGSNGMIRGQFYDIYNNGAYNLSYVLDVYKGKTCALFLASIVSVALLLDLDDEKVSLLEEYAYNLGLSFQIQDDLLDGSNKDELNILNVLDKKDTLIFLNKISKLAEEKIDKFQNNQFHKDLIDYLNTRTN